MPLLVLGVALADLELVGVLEHVADGDGLKKLAKNREAAAIITEYSPGFTTDPQMKMVMGLTLRKLAGEPDPGDDPDMEFFRAGNAYACTKRFVIEFSRANTVRFAERGVRILSVSPGSYLTPMHQLLIDNQPDMAEAQLELTPLGRWGRPVEIAGLVEFVCSPHGGYVCGVDILADGGTIAMQRVGQIG